MSTAPALPKLTSTAVGFPPSEWSEQWHVLQGLPGDKLPQTPMRMTSGLCFKTSLQGGRRAGGASCDRGEFMALRKQGHSNLMMTGERTGEKLTHERPPLQRRSHAQCSPLHAQFSFISWLFLLGVLLLLLTYIHCAQYWFRIDSVLGTSNALTAFTPPTLSLESPLPYSPTSLFSLSFSLSSLPSAFITYMIQNICLYDFMYL